ncbi:RHS repeat domain-containing protein [Dysgonomonas mossii]|uniref:RHS repeat domain-containing protein n=1 Tax=Dysgonomonas mossii TaxID=163665 RepID=UPI0039A22E8B
MSRLTKATYLGNGSVYTNGYETAYSYDKQGNILTLKRNGKKDASTYAMVDDLTMTYSGNQLVRVNDAVANIDYAPSMDFKNYSNVATEYTYNANGAMNKDLNKGITEIQYNSLNLPKQMDIKSPVAEARNEYTYLAGGQKLKVVQKWNPNYSTTPVVGSAINATALTQSKTTDYVGNKMYENGTLKRILIDGGYIEGNVYHYYLTDHLGNNRVVVNASGTLVQKNHYYPFGSIFAGTTGPDKQPYKYNGKELDQMHGLNLYDYSARYYESAVGRFTSVDPLAEKYYNISPYTYVANNPLKYVNPTGKELEDPIVWFLPSEKNAKSIPPKHIEYKRGDNRFYVFGHGTPTSIYNWEILKVLMKL